MRTYVAALVVTLLTLSCKDAEFAGRTRDGAGEAKPQNSGTPDTGTPGANPNNPGTNGDTSTPGSTPGTNPGGQPIGGNNGQSTPKPSIIDIINDLINNKPTDKVTPLQPDKNTIDLGDNRFFHIGDNNFTDSRCKRQISRVVLKGIQFYVEFHVERDGTTVTLEMRKLCGVDYNDSNEVRILREGSQANVMNSKFVQVSDDSILLTAPSLAAGSYIVLVESHPNTGRNNDRDDYLVGNVKIRADNPITPGKIGAR